MQGHTWKVFAVSDIVWNQLNIKIDGKEKVGELHLGEENKGVDAGAVRFINWDRDVQEAVPPSNLNMKMVKSSESKRKVYLG